MCSVYDSVVRIVMCVISEFTQKWTERKGTIHVLLYSIFAYLKVCFCCDIKCYKLTLKYEVSKTCI